jgi:RNA ligase (TIGR02306 family)
MDLATIETVTKVVPIEGANNIELAEVLGWNVVIKKGEFNKGDLCIYIRIDTTVNPTFKCFSHLANSKNPNKRIRINTRKFINVYSQGLLISIDNYKLEPAIGIDVTDIFDVKKYEKEENESFSNKPKGDFPTELISKTNEEHLKNKITALEKLVNKKIYISKKMDGSSLTIIVKDKSIIVCSRNYIVNEDSTMYKYVINEKINDRITAENNLAIQGEFCGPNINSNQMKLNKYKFYVFNIKDLNENRYLNLDEMNILCKKLDLETVPILDIMNFDESWTIQKFQDYANNITYGDSCGEGIVIRDCNDMEISFKIINQNYKD